MFFLGTICTEQRKGELNMKKRLQANPDAPFQRIPDACRITGLSMFYLRNGCRDGTVPHIKSGSTYMVNVPALLKKLNGEG